MHIQLDQCRREGQGTVGRRDANEFEVQVQTPLTLWAPAPASGNTRFSFDCSVQTPNSAMLFLACARNWQGQDFFAEPRTGEYYEYSVGSLECYSVGFNRTAHVTNENQPNASSANIRRIGGAANYRKYTAAQLRPGGILNLPVWNEWNCRSILAGARELHSGINRYIHYDLEFQQPYIRMFTENEEVLTVVDHLPAPLHGGWFAIRNMTPGAVFRLRNFQVQTLPELELELPSASAAHGLAS